MLFTATARCVVAVAVSCCVATIFAARYGPFEKNIKDNHPNAVYSSNYNYRGTSADYYQPYYGPYSRKEYEGYQKVAELSLLENISRKIFRPYQYVLNALRRTVFPKSPFERQGFAGLFQGLGGLTSAIQAAAVPLSLAAVAAVNRDQIANLIDPATEAPETIGCASCAHGSYDKCVNGVCTCGGSSACSGNHPYCEGGVCKCSAVPATCSGALPYCFTDGTCKVCTAVLSDSTADANGKNWFHKGCALATPICSSGTCTACASDGDCSSIQSIGSAPSTLKCHGTVDGDDGKAPTLGAGGCAVCKNNMLENPKGVVHSGCTTTDPLCSVADLNTDGVCGKCTATTNAADAIADDDTCNNANGIANYKSLGQCGTAGGGNGMCRCWEGPAQSTAIADPDAGCPTQNPTCENFVCKCGTGTDCTNTCTAATGTGTCT